MASNHKCNLPGSVALHLTEVCNLRCKMCYAWGETGFYSTAGSKTRPKVLDFELLERIVKELAPRRPFYSLFGGEPLMYPHLEEFIVMAKEAGSFIDTPTNGTLLEKNAPMLVKTGFDSVRISLDGPQEVNDNQRGKGGYDKAMAGIETLFRERAKPASKGPLISIIYTVTEENHLSIEQFFLKDLDLNYINWVTIQMQNFVTEKMGKAYARMLESEFGITSDSYWRAMLRDPHDFDEMDIVEMTRQLRKVIGRMSDLGKPVLTIPVTASIENLKAYFEAKWGEMTDVYRSCPVPWTAVDITAAGDLAPCHVFYDLTLGNLHERTFEEVWNGERYRTFREYMKRHKLMSICHGCCILYLTGEKTF